MKKVMSLSKCLVLLLALVIIQGSGVAAPGKVFSDVPENHWAERYIARMSLMNIFKGYEDGSFGISQPVSRFETVTTIVRVMGLESQATGLSIPASFKHPAAVPDWAKKYVAMGVVQGIISGDDLVSFRGGEPAKRYEVAEFIGKAMGLTDAAKQHALDKLPFIDEKDIPARARGYISLLKTNGLMEGNENGTFKPLANVTRGEMAVLTAKLNERLGKFPDKEIKGKVSQVTQSTITIKTSASYETLIVDEGCYIFLKDRKGNLSGLTTTDSVLAVKNGFKAQLLDVNVDSGTLDQNRSGKISGHVVSIEFRPELEITISKADKAAETYPISDDCIIVRSGDEVLIKDILPGDKVEILLEAGQVEEISAEPTTGNIEGKIKQILIRDKALLTLVNEDSEEYTYELKSDSRIRKDGETVTLLELRAGDYVNLQWESSFASKVFVESRYTKGQVTGKVIEVNTGLNMLILLPDGEGADDNLPVFSLESTKLVTLDGVVSSRLSKLNAGDRVVVVGDLSDQYVTAQTIIILGAE